MKKSNEKMREIGKGGVEEYLRMEVVKRGGFCIKQNPQWHIGVYDRLVGLPDLLCLVETKRPKGGRLRETQLKFKNHLQRLGLPGYVLCTKESIDAFLEPYRCV